MYHEKEHSNLIRDVFGVLIQKIMEGSKVVVQAEDENNSIQFHSIVVFGDEEGLFIEPILHNEKLINFKDTDGILYTANIVNEEDKKLYVWPGVIIKAVIARDRKIYHLLISESNVSPTNRREAFRLPLGLTGSAQIGANNKIHSIYIKDISATGIAFFCDEKVEVKGEELIHITLDDKTLNTKLNMRCIKVRTAEVQDKILFGCKFIQKNDEIFRYIQRRQLYNQAKKNNLIKKRYL